MERSYALTISSLLAFLSAAGFLKQYKKFAGMNVDTSHSFLRVPVTLGTTIGAMKGLSAQRTSLKYVGVLYLVIGSIGLVNRKLGGLLPSGLTKRDLIYHFLVGSLTLWMGSRPGKLIKPRST